MAHIVLEMEKLRDLYCGLGQYCLHLGQGLASCLEEDFSDFNVGIYAPETTKSLIPSSFKHYPLHKWHRTASCALPKADIWHATHQESPYTKSLIPYHHRHYVLTIHDLNFLFEEKHTATEKWWWKRTLQKKINQASALVFISHFTKESVTEELKLPLASELPQYVIYNGAALSPPSPIPDQPSWSGRDFFFSIGTVLPKKNFHVLIEMLRHYPDPNMEMILAGSLFHPYAKEMQETINRAGLQKRFHLVGKIDEGAKCWFYQNCKAFLFPSLLEGFGLPIVEAMSFGRPIFLSKHTVLPEIGGPDSFYFDNFTPEHMVETVVNGLEAFKLDYERKFKLITRSRRFNWNQVAKEYLMVYDNLLKHQ